MYRSLDCLTILYELMKTIHSISKEKGFYDKVNQYDPYFIATQISNMHSELSEALECLRDNDLGIRYGVNGKPEGFTVELADCVIRIFDTCQSLGLPLANAISEKIEYNKTRSYKHGRKNW